MSDEMPDGQHELVEVGTTPRGYTLYRQANGVGGHRYWSDRIGGGAVVWDTCIASVEELETAMRIEAALTAVPSP